MRVAVACAHVWGHCLGAPTVLGLRLKAKSSCLAAFIARGEHFEENCSARHSVSGAASMQSIEHRVRLAINDLNEQASMF